MLKKELYCQFWYKEDPFFITKPAHKNFFQRNFQNQLNPVLLNCILPGNPPRRVPAAVTVSFGNCTGSNNLLKIHDDSQSKKSGIGVCVSRVTHFTDKSVSLIEWLEMLRILGANKVYIYTFYIHPNISKVLDYYSDLGFVEVTRMSAIGGKSQDGGLFYWYNQNDYYFDSRNEKVDYNDCFFKYMYRHRFLTILDIDEIIVPSNTRNWAEMLQTIPKTHTSTLKFKSSLFPLDQPLISKLDKGFLEMVPHVYGTSGLDHVHKSFFNTDNVIQVGNHKPQKCIKRCKAQSVDIKYGKVHHYRSKCYPGGHFGPLCKAGKLKIDTTALIFQPELLSNFNKTLIKLGFLK